MFIYKIGLCTVLFFLVSCAGLPDISSTNRADVDPWLTINGEPSTSVEINWLTEVSDKTILSYGTDVENLQNTIDKEEFEKLHHVLLEDLQPGTEYYYSLNGKNYSFKTASDIIEDYTISVIGDLQPFKKQSRQSNVIMAQALIRENPDLIVQVGDVSESGGMNFLQVRTLKNITGYASKIPFMAAAGNHDYYTRGKENFRQLFPYNYPSDDELYHSLHYKNASLFFLDVHIENSEVSAEQKKWFEEELKKTAQLENHWIFVILHDVVLSSGSASMNFDLQSWLVPLADRFGVDGVFFGHSHNYEHWLYQYGKSGLVHNSEDSPSGKPIHYFCTGGGGAYMRIERFLERQDRVVESQWVENWENDEITVNAVVKKWDSENYLEYKENSLNRAPGENKNYYQLPEWESYSGYNRIYGYLYGEKTLHYINLDFSGDNSEICTISVHYPDGSLLTGPEGKYPQTWTLDK